MSENDLAWRVEETCFNAFPSLKQVLLDGWIIRFAERLSRRANSANPLRADPAPVEAIVEAVERLYRKHRQPAIFRVPSFVAAAIDPPLAARGYLAEGETCVLHGAMAQLHPRSDPEVRLAAHAGSDWLAAMAALQRHDSGQRVTYRRVVRAIALPAAFAALQIDGRIVALAYGTVHDRLMCYESVITDPRWRRQGLARRIIAALADWARNQGAEGACLQVVADNAPAVTLYKQFGLNTELHRYHYRRAPAAEPGP